MIYLRSFNEGSRGIVELLHSVTKFCNDTLVYLIDEGFDIEIEKGVLNKDICIYFRGKGNRYFTWDEIESDFIPFIIKINEDYELYNRFIGVDTIKQPVDAIVSIRDPNGEWSHLTVDQVEKGEIPGKLEVICLRVADFKD